MTLEVIWGSSSPYAWRVLLTLEVKGLGYDSRLTQFSRGDARPSIWRSARAARCRSCATATTRCRNPWRSWPISTASIPPILGRSTAETGLIWKAISEFQSCVVPLAERYPALESWRQRVTALPGYARTYPPHWREAA
jgi:glutathione S-transferase